MAPGGSPIQSRKRNAVGISRISRNDHSKRPKAAPSSPSAAKTKTSDHGESDLGRRGCSAMPWFQDWQKACGGFPPTIDTHAITMPVPPMILTAEQVQRWHHSFAGTACSSLQFPVSKYRLLGVITKTLSWTHISNNNPEIMETFLSFHKNKNSSSSSKPKGKTKNATAPSFYPKIPARRPHMTEAAARRELLQLLPEEAPREFQRRALELKDAWDRELQSSPALQGQRAPWDGHGNLLPDLRMVQNANGAQSYVPVTDLYQWLCTVQQQQQQLQQKGAQTADTSLDQMLQILQACQDLQDPSHLWRIPLLLTVPLVSCNNNNNNNSTTATSTTIQMGVYGHRLLPLATTKTLGVVLNALDLDSYRVTAPLCQLQQPEQPTFATSPFPVVTFDTDDNDDPSDRQPALTTAAVEKENRRNSKTGQQLDGEKDDDGSSDDSSLDDNCQKPAAQPDGRNYDDWMEDRYDQNNVTDRDDQRISAFTTKGLLKLLENTGVDMTGYDTKIAPRLESLLQLQLLPHQQHAIQWMVQMEQDLGNNAKFGMNSLLWEEREFWDGGRYYYCPALGQLRLEPPANCRGGLLCDEMGLGKTVEVLGLILATLPELKELAQQSGGSYATLIVVPPALVGQWRNEIVKTTGQGTLTVEYVDFHPTTTVPLWTTTTAPHPDIVLTTYKALQVPKIARQLHETCWGRVVLDEMQEIRSSTTKIAQTCEKLQCNRRWMLSGTPLFEGIEDLRGELNFLRLEPFGANCEDGFFDFMIKQPWEARDIQAIEILKTLSTIMLRRSKSMTVCASGAPLLGLPPLTVEYVPVQQTESERALYCYLEAVVSEEARAKDQGGKSKSSSRLLCLRLLREMCTSAVLLNGGLGVVSQLKELNNLLIKQARRAANSAATARHGREYHHGTIVMSCDEAIVHLAQLQEATRAGSDKVSSLALGFGQGLSRRVRASDSVELKLAEAEERLHLAIAENQIAKSQRAKIRWHGALEKVTMGVLPNRCVLRAKTKFRTIWRLRSLASTLRAQIPGPVLPLVLRRGWRPDSRMTQSWHRIRPDFFWSHPVSFILEDVPCQVSEKELRHSLAEFLEDIAVGDSYSLAEAESNFDVSKIGASPAADSWRAGLVFSSYEAAAAFLEATRRPSGIHLAHQEIVPAIETRILQTKAAYREARAMESVQPTGNAAAKRRIAKDAYKSALLGLRIVSTSAARRTAGDVIVQRAQADFRSADLNSCQSFFVSSSVLMDELCQALTTTNALISTEQRKIVRYCQAAGMEGPVDGVTALSAFDSLQALSNGASESTSCCICLDILGSNDGGDDDARNTACICMTKCGHLYCRGCLSECLDAATTNYARPQCPACRKQIDSAQDVFFIDPTKKETTASATARENAKATVLTLSQALEQSSGCLSPQLWYELFLSIDDPIGGDKSLDHRVSALPRHFMAHLREAIDGLPVHSTVKTSPRVIDIEKNYISSKVKYLLQNLPKNERSVVFSSSKATVQHLLFLLRSIGIECRALFSGQKVDNSERAVAEWKSTEYETTGEALIPVPVLLVQSGAAASGLTLTASSKLFLLEPFLHQSEEQQAFGRSHRYGQEHPVQAKVLYTPVSVESRLLEWRRRGAAPTIDTKIVYVKENEDSDDEDEKSNPEAESDQTRFLLGLHAGSLSATAEMNVN